MPGVFDVSGVSICLASSIGFEPCDLAVFGYTIFDWLGYDATESLSALADFLSRGPIGGECP